MHNLPSGYCKIVCFFDDRQRLLKLGWEVLSHLWYSSWDFHLFWYLQNSVSGKKFQFPGRLQKGHLEHLFADKDKVFGEDGVMKLPLKWQKVVEQNEEYIVLGENEKLGLLFLLQS